MPGADMENPSTDGGGSYMKVGHTVAKIDGRDQDAKAQGAAGIPAKDAPGSDV